MGVMLDPELRDIIKPAEQNMPDWMHDMLCSGVFNKCMNCLMEEMKHECTPPIRASDLHDYFQAWSWPRRGHNKKLLQVFCKKQAKSSREAGLFKGTASEVISVFPIIATFVQRVVLSRGECVNACHALLLLCNALDMLLRVPRGTVSGEDLGNAITKFLLAYVLAFGYDALIPKIHDLLHLLHMFLLHNFLLTCWVHERKHRMCKRYCNDICNTISFERSVLGEVTGHQLFRLRQPDTFSFSVGLVNPKPARKKLADILHASFSDIWNPAMPYMTSVVARYCEWECCHRYDVVLVREPVGFSCGQVWFHASVNGSTLSCISMWTLIAMDGAYATWRFRDNPLLMDTTDILDCVIWSRTGDVVTTIIPYERA